MNYQLFDGLALSDQLADPAHPKPIRLLAVGENMLTKDGEELKLVLSAADLDAIAGYQRKKGEKIPLDSRHALLLAAEKVKLEEPEALRAMPHGVASLGFANLEVRPDGLYAVDLELCALAAELVAQGSLRYYSPVIRGLDRESPLRISSIALDNVPALNNLKMIAAGAEIEDIQKKGPDRMNKIEIALRKLFGDSALALSAETEGATASRIEALAAELPGLRSKAAECDTLKLAAESSRKESLIADAIAKNKITNAARASLLTADVVWLADFLEKLPENGSPVPTGKLPDEDDDKPAGKPQLTDSEKEMARRMNLSDEEFIKTKSETKEC